MSILIGIGARESVKTGQNESDILTLTKGVQVVASDETGVTLELRTDTFDTKTVQHVGETFERLSIPAYIHGFTQETGKPELPLKGILLDIPEDTLPALTVGV